MGMEEWIAKMETNIEEQQIKCVACGQKKSEPDMQKIFARGEGICKRCWNSDAEV